MSDTGLRPIPKRLLLAPALFAAFRAAAPPMRALEVEESDVVTTWVIELSDGSLVLPEDELEDG